MSMLKSCQSHVSVLFTNEFDGSNLTFSPLKSLCKLMASNKSSNNTVMRENVLDIVWWNDNSLEFSKATFTASQIIDCPYLVGFDKCLNPPSSSNLLGKILLIIHNFHKWQKEVALTSILCAFAHHWVQSCSSDIKL